MGKLKPRFHTLFFIYLFLAGLVFGLLYYSLDYGFGKDATEHFLKIEENSIKDVVVDISKLPSDQQVYPHAGGLKKLTTSQGIEVPLYVENSENVDDIKLNDSIVKRPRSSEIIVFSADRRTTLYLSDVISLRQQNQLNSGLKWLFAYVLLGFFITLIPLDK